jgi:hypothetical protein
MNTIIFEQSNNGQRTTKYETYLVNHNITYFIFLRVTKVQTYTSVLLEQNSPKVFQKLNEAKSKVFRNVNLYMPLFIYFIVTGYNFGEITIHTLKPIQWAILHNGGEVVFFSFYYFSENFSFIMLHVLSIVSAR